MPLVNRQILVVGTEFWSGPLLSKHHIVLELCKQNRVLYLEPVYHAGSILRGQRQVMQYPFLYHELHPAGLQRLRPWWLPKSDPARAEPPVWVELEVPDTLVHEVVLDLRRR